MALRQVGVEAVPHGGVIYYYTLDSESPIRMECIGKAACAIVNSLEGGEYCRQAGDRVSAFAISIDRYILTIDDYVIIVSIVKPDYRWIANFEVFKNRTAAFYARKLFNDPQLSSLIRTG